MDEATALEEAPPGFNMNATFSIFFTEENPLLGPVKPDREETNQQRCLSQTRPFDRTGLDYSVASISYF